MVRAPGGQLITRIKTEAAAGKLAADVVDHSDRGLMQELDDLFQDYAPPNAADYRPDALVSPKLWPGVTLGWAIAYNTAAGEERAQDLDGSHQARIQGQADRPGGRPVGRHDLDAHHVRAPGAGRGLLDEAGRARHRALSRRARRLSDALVRGEVSIAPLLYNIIYTKIVEGAPAETIFAPEGVPIIPYADGITKTSKSPNAAKLFMNWRLSRKARPSPSSSSATSRR